MAPMRAREVYTATGTVRRGTLASSEKTAAASKPT